MFVSEGFQRLYFEVRDRQFIGIQSLNTDSDYRSDGSTELAFNKSRVNRRENWNDFQFNSNSKKIYFSIKYRIKYFQP